MSGFNRDRGGQNNTKSLQHESPGFWVIFRIGVAVVMPLVALYLVLEWLYPVETGLLTLVSGLAAALSIVWALLNRRTEYWDEFREHAAEYRSQGRVVWYMPLVMISPVPLLYVAIPREIEPGVVALSFVDHIAAGSILIFALSASVVAVPIHNIVFVVLVLVLFLAVFVIQWSIPYFIQKLILK